MEAPQGGAPFPRGVAIPRLIEPLPGSEAIGYSYNTFGYYANPRSILKELFSFAPQQEMNVEGCTWLVSPDFLYTCITDTETCTISNRTKDFYSCDLAASLKLSATYNLFSSSVQADFCQRIIDETDTTYTSVRTNVNKWRLKLRDDVAGLRCKLLPAFKEALQGMNPKELFDIYGTHYVNEVLVGGRADYVACTRTSVFEQSTSISAVAEQSYMCITGTAEYKEVVEIFRENSITSLYVLGGSSLCNIRDPSTYQAWLRSIDTYPVFSGFTGESLKPIWELAECSERQQLLREAAACYIPICVTHVAIVGLEVIVSDSYCVSPPCGYIKINYNLNCSSGGRYVFLCYKKERISVVGAAGDPDPITDIMVICVDNYDPYVPSCYTKIDKDLNLGAGGKCIYICYSRDKSKQEDGLPIRGLRVIGAEERSVAPYGFTKMDIDLSMYAGGECIYLCKSRHLE